MAVSIRLTASVKLPDASISECDGFSHKRSFEFARGDQLLDIGPDAYDKNNPSARQGLEVLWVHNERATKGSERRAKDQANDSLWFNGSVHIILCVG